MNIFEKIKLQGQTLYDLRQDINKLEEANKGQVDKLKEQRDKLQSVLIDSLTKNDLTSIKVASGDSFILQSRKSVVVTESIFAEQWAVKNCCVSLNKTLVGQKLKEIPESKWPRGLTMEDKQFISIRKAKAPIQKITPEIEEKMMN